MLTPATPPPNCPWCGCHVIRSGGGKRAKHCSIECSTETRYRRVLAAMRKKPSPRPPWLLERSPIMARALQRLRLEATLPVVTDGPRGACEHTMCPRASMEGP